MTVINTPATTLETLMTELEASPTIRRIVHELNQRCAVLADRRSSYVSLRPFPIGAIAAYAHARRISVAVEPTKALQLHFPGASHHRVTRATTYVVIGDRDLERVFHEVLDLVVDSLSWRATGPATTLGAGRRRTRQEEPELCPIGWLTVTPSGVCGCCCE